MLRVLLVLMVVAFLPGLEADQKPQPKQPNPLGGILFCEENVPPKLCPPHCDC